MKCILATSQENEFCKELGNESFYLELETEHGSLRIEYKANDDEEPSNGTCQVIGFRAA